MTSRIPIKLHSPWKLPYQASQSLVLYIGCGGGLVTQLCPTLSIPWTVAHQASPFMNFPGRILEWVTLSFSRGSSQPQDQTHVSCIAVNPLSLSHHGLTQYRERAQYLDKDMKNPSPGFLSSSSEALFSLVPCPTNFSCF